MRRIRIGRPSPAMAVALLELVVALGGTSYAASKVRAKNIGTGAVGTRAVKNGSLKSVDVKNDSLGGADIREERLKASRINVRGLKTVPGAKNVPKNSIGASDLANVTRRFGAAVAVANGAVARADANCSKGEIVVGGGGRWADSVAGEFLQSSYADTDSGWRVVGGNASGAPRSVRAFAMCLAP